VKDIEKMFTFGKSDPYLLLRITHSVMAFKTMVQEKKLTPVWNETTELGMTNPLFDILRVLMRDKSIASDNDMAQADIPLSWFGDLIRNEAWYPLTPCNGRKKGWQIKLKLQLSLAPKQTYSKGTPGITEVPKGSMPHSVRIV
jgi:Ca2+-dependent lipid-binding protein